MKQVAKIAIIDSGGNYLLMYRNEHPMFGNDPDLPGGTLEDGEQPFETMIREVYEEAGIAIDGTRITKIYSGSEYSRHETHYSLYITWLDTRPTVVMSWEHASFAWLEREAFLAEAQRSNDTYMRMVYNELKEKTF